MQEHEADFPPRAIRPSELDFGYRKLDTNPISSCFDPIKSVARFENRWEHGYLFKSCPPVYTSDWSWSNVYTD